MVPLSPSKCETFPPLICWSHEVFLPHHFFPFCISSLTVMHCMSAVRKTQDFLFSLRHRVAADLSGSDSSDRRLVIDQSHHTCLLQSSFLSCAHTHTSVSLIQLRLRGAQKTHHLNVIRGWAAAWHVLSPHRVQAAADYLWEADADIQTAEDNCSNPLPLHLHISFLFFYSPATMIASPVYQEGKKKSLFFIRRRQHRAWWHIMHFVDLDLGIVICQ